MTSNLDPKSVGERLQHFREVRGLTRAALSLKLGISKEQLAEMEAGKRELTKENAEILKETFSLDIAWLFGGDVPE